jgi:hypothetical protein
MVSSSSKSSEYFVNVMMQGRTSGRTINLIGSDELAVPPNSILLLDVHPSWL